MTTERVRRASRQSSAARSSPNSNRSPLACLGHLGGGGIGVVTLCAAGRSRCVIAFTCSFCSTGRCRRRAFSRQVRRLRPRLRFQQRARRDRCRAEAMQGRLQDHPDAARLCGALDRHGEPLRRARFCGGTAHFLRPEQRHAELLQIRRQGMCDPHMGLRRPRLKEPFSSVLSESQASSIQPITKAGGVSLLLNMTD